MSPAPELSLSLARMRGCSIGREQALRQVFGESSPPGIGFEIAAAPDTLEVGPLRVLRFDGGGEVCHWVSSGLSDPGRGDLPRDRQADERFSGLGIELVLASNDSAAFAAATMTDLATQIAAQDQPAMTGDLIELSNPITIPEPESTSDVDALTHVIVVDGGPYRARIVLPTGHAVLLHLIGLFEAEADALWGLGNSERVKRVLGPQEQMRVTRPERSPIKFSSH